MSKTYSLKELSDFLQAECRGNESCKINSIASLDKAKEGQISFLERSKFRPFLKTTMASVVILKDRDLARFDGNAIIVKDPYVAYAKLTSLFVRDLIPTTNRMGSSCSIAETAIIAETATISDNVTIGENSIIGSGCFIGENTSIGANCKLYANVSIYHDITIGDSVVIHSGAVIGSDGFGMANDNGKWVKIYQLGSVTIGYNVEVGANTCIDRGALENTKIGDGTKLDNLIQIAHNVDVGQNTVIAGCTGIAGSTKIGSHCMIGGAVNISGHIEICDKAIITGGGSVARSITNPDVYTAGLSVIKHREWMKIISKIYQLNELNDRIKKLEEK